MEKQIDEIKAMIRTLRSNISINSSKRLDLDKCERMIDRLGSLSVSCKKCQQYLLEVKDTIKQLESNADRIEKLEIKPYKKLMNDIISHLQKEHKLVTEGFYLSIYMSVGMSLGLVFGLTIFDNIALGLPIGMCIGIAIGASLDADAKKKGKII
ncbi:hypothetical protein [Fredinandcohnia quinoae]|uniref:Glycine zipper-like domain-containing protein n=1 Tax=Fredinandcohnia quinoae TaxID=2918902 RepID=A0AAW5E6Q4_9BACI|nr:hypothetical protein [Fredinandcohnia sp. SECRCQ15]MCH1624459.1 hypothetical protein [Fredinandcohnia sp. SECRCQ15]